MSHDDANVSRDVAEAAREQLVGAQSFLRELFMGRFRLDLIDPFPLPDLDRPEFVEFHRRLRAFLAEHVDPVAIDETGRYPEEVIAGLAELGAFGMKIPTRYGGLGLSHAEYVQVMKLVGSYDANIAALLSAHQAIGVPQPILLFGTEEQKRRYLPRCARGAISAFALTEPAVGSDPAKLATEARLSDDGSHFVLNGEKLWCTNGTLAELLVVMARDTELGKINAFVVETDAPGVEVTHRCHFMGLRALANAVIRLRDVRVPVDQLIGARGAGLRIALTTLNTGRLTLPAATTGIVKHCLEIMRTWGSARVQWGRPVGEHEAVTHKIADAAASAYAMESVAELVGDMADRRGYDLRLEAAAAKEWNTVRAWHTLDDTLQVRGGRGYETERSLAARGEPAIGVERMMRDARINLIFEGSSEIMHLFMAREALDEHLTRAGILVDPRAKLGAKLRALLPVVAFYAWWYPTRWLGWSLPPRDRRFGALARHVRYARRATRRLARALFHAIVRHGPKLEKKQALLFRAVDVAMEIFVLVACTARARRLQQTRDPRAASMTAMAELSARRGRRRIEELFAAMRSNDDASKYALGRAVLAGEHLALEEGAMPLAYDASELIPATMEELMASERPAHPAALPHAPARR